MAKRKPRNSQGVYKSELRNEQMKFLVSAEEKALIMEQCQHTSQSDYLRYLILEAPHRTTVYRTSKTSSLASSLTELGRELNKIAKAINRCVLNQETLSINSSEFLVFKNIQELLLDGKDKFDDIIIKKKPERHVQIKFTVTKSELLSIQKKLKVKNLRFSTYMRQQITGYKDDKQVFYHDLFLAISGIFNNINQINSAIIAEERARHLVIINNDTKFLIKNLVCFLLEIRETLT